MFIHVAASSGHELLNLNLSFKLILKKFEVVFFMSGVRMLPLLKNWRQFIQIDQHYTMALTKWHSWHTDPILVFKTTYWNLSWVQSGPWYNVRMYTWYIYWDTGLKLSWILFTRLILQEYKQLYRLLSIAVYIFLHPEGKDSIVHCTITNFPAASIFCISSMNAQENKIMQVET